MKRLHKLLLYLYLFFAPFTAWFAYTIHLRLPVMIVLSLCVAALPLLIIRFGRFLALLLRDKEDLILPVFLLFVWIAFALGFGERRSFNHALAYTFAVTVYFAIPKALFRLYRIDALSIARVVAYSALLCCGVVFVESVLVNLFRIEIRHLFIRDALEPSFVMYYYLGRIIHYTVPGMADEPGLMALLLNVICPIGIWYFSQARRYALQFVLFGCYLIAMLLIQSSAGIFFASVAGLVIWFVNIRKVRHIVQLYFAVGTIAIAAMLIIRGVFDPIVRQFAPLLQLIWLKISLSGVTASDSMRSFLWQQALRDWTASPFVGNGPGYGVEMQGSGYMSLFFTLLSEIGIFGFLAFWSFLAVIFLKGLLLQRHARLPLLIGFLACVLHLLVVSDFYVAPFWIIIMLIQLEFERERLRRSAPTALNPALPLPVNPLSDTLRPSAAD